MTDWPTICRDLRKIFGSLTQVARLLEYKNPEYLTKLERGEISDPRYSLGVALLEMHNKFCKGAV